MSLLRLARNLFPPLVDRNGLRLMQLHGSVCSRGLLTFGTFFRRISTSGDEIDLRWHYPANLNIVEKEEINQKYGFSDVACLTLNSRKLIQEERFYQTMEELTRILPVLRTCLQMRENQLWVCESLKPRTALQFKVVKEGQWKQEVKGILHEQFHSFRGPMWRAMLLKEEELPSPMSGLQKEYPHQYKLIAGFHTGIISGVVIGRLFDLLKRLLDNESVDDSEPVRNTFMCSENINELNDLLMEIAKNNTHSGSEFQKSQPNQPEMIKFLRKSEGRKDIMTDFEICYIDVNTTQNIKKLCKSYGISVNSFVTAVCDMALLRVAKSAGFQEDRCTIITRLPVDCRRYLKSLDPEVMTPLSFQMNHPKLMASSSLESFWEYASRIHLDLKLRVANKQPLHEYILANEKRLSRLEEKERTQQLAYDYLICNVIQKSQESYGTDGTVQITDHKDIGCVKYPDCNMLIMLYETQMCLQMSVSFSSHLDRGKILQFIGEVNNIIGIVTKQ